MLKLGKKEDGGKYTAEDIADISLDEVKKMIVEQVPDAFEKKASKKTAGKKTTAKKATATKKTAVKKSAPKKK